MSEASSTDPSRYETLLLEWAEDDVLVVIEIAAHGRCVLTSDRREGISAAREKRPPKFTGS